MLPTSCWLSARRRPCAGSRASCLRTGGMTAIRKVPVARTPGGPPVEPSSLGNLASEQYGSGPPTPPFRAPERNLPALAAGAVTRPALTALSDTARSGRCSHKRRGRQPAALTQLVAPLVDAIRRRDGVVLRCAALARWKVDDAGAGGRSALPGGGVPALVDHYAERRSGARDGIDHLEVQQVDRCRPRAAVVDDHPVGAVVDAHAEQREGA